MITKTGRPVNPAMPDFDPHPRISAFFLLRVLLSSAAKDFMTTNRDGRNKIFIEVMDLI
jgi:hypothetical protein